MDFSREFLELAVTKGVLRFGEFKTKAGRLSPYFFNSALFDDGTSFAALCRYYAEAIIAAKLDFDVLFGPAYKGISLATGTAMQLANLGHNVPFCFNRKEAKDHGEGGVLVGAPLKGRVLIIDDVISAGTSVRESVELIRSQGAQVAGVIIALDRMERGTGEKSAAQEVRDAYGIQVVAVANVLDLMNWLSTSPHLRTYLDAITRYRANYGVDL